MQQEPHDTLLSSNQIKKLEQDYINSNSASFIGEIQTMLHSASNDIKYYEHDFAISCEKLYDLASHITPAALPYANLTTLMFDSEDEGESAAIFIQHLSDFLKEKFESLKAAKTLTVKDECSISVISKAIEHLNLALSQKSSLYLKQKQELIVLDNSLKAERNNLIKLSDDLTKEKSDLDILKKDTKDYKEKYEKITTDFLSMMGIFSTIIFAVFGGLSQIGAIGDNLSETPIYKVLMYISLSSITLLFVVFLSFNAISKLTNMKLRSCPCDNSTECNHKIYEKHPSLCFALFFFVDLFVFSVILRVTQYSDWTNPINELLASSFTNLSSALKIRYALILVFLFTNICIGWKIYSSNFKKDKNDNKDKKSGNEKEVNKDKKAEIDTDSNEDKKAENDTDVSENKKVEKDTTNSKNKEAENNKEVSEDKKTKNNTNNSADEKNKKRCLCALLPKICKKEENKSPENSEAPTDEG
ncbi:hypothetical protein [Enterococcus sp. AZ109]|uniref:hypothetical protein n=1 Tax=Enterococcus sp. AZ109 TaxID=2774634 RepID=UPI003F275A46